MRKFNYLMSFIALGAVLTTSCSKDELEVLGSPETDGTTEIGGYPVTISASTPASDTKVTIDRFTVAWEEGDKMTVGNRPKNSILLHA